MERMLSVVLTLAAVVIAGAVVKRELAGSGEPPDVQYLEGWQTLTASAVLEPEREPADEGALTVLVLSDLECPFCRRFHLSLRAVQNQYPGRLRLAFLHYPLGYHPHAVPGARALECADRQGQASRFLDEAFAAQAQFDSTTWGEVAERAGVTDLVAFEACIAEEALPARVAAGLAIADSIEATGTPTVVLEGWRFRSPPDSARLAGAVTDLLAGKKPRS